MEPITLGAALGWGLTTIGGAFVGSYLGAYMKRKGEDRAIKEGFGEVLRQTQETTTATKSIEAKISDEMWGRQKRWEMKRETVFQMSEKISGVDDALVSMHSTHQHYRALAQSGQMVDSLAKSERLAKVSENWGKAADAYDRSLGLMTLVCSNAACQELRELIIFMRQMVPLIQQRPPVYLESAPELAKRLKKVQDLLRKELGVEPV